VENAGLGFATIPYLHSGRPHDYIPDFIIRLKGDGARYLILETKGFDELAEVKAAAAKRWCAAVNADGQFGSWEYVMVRNVAQVSGVLD
jgi:type III restriction enzyme